MKLTQKISGWMLLACAALLIAGGGAQSAGIPPLINYQGKLTNVSGDPVADGQYAVTFSIYEVPTGGTALWSESWPLLQTYGGDFSAMLGSVTAIPATFFSEHPTTYLGIKVGFDAEMIPRQQIGAVAYAFHAGNVEGSDVPSGGIILWSGPADQIPTGWALCDGANGTPDLRDRFVVGAGADYAIGAQGGSATASIAAHTHIVTGTAAVVGAHTHSGTTAGITGYDSPLPDRAPNYDDVSASQADHNHSFTAGSSGDHSHSVSGTATSGGGGTLDTLPPYLALAFIMKL